MERAKAFLCVCGGIFFLALSWHLGAQSARAQAPQAPVVSVAGSGSNLWMAVTGDGFSYISQDNGYHWEPRANVLAGGVVPTHQESFGAVKARYR